MAKTGVELWISAQALVDEYGSDAASAARMCAEEMGKRGDLEGQARCRQIASAAEMIQAKNGHRITESVESIRLKKIRNFRRQTEARREAIQDLQTSQLRK